MLRHLLVVLLLTAPGTRAFAQPTRDALVAGARVRVSRLGSPPAVATLDSLRGDTLFLRLGGAVAWPALARLEVSHGRRPLGRAAARGAGRGALWGVGAGVAFVAFGALADARSPCNDCFIDAKGVGLVAGVAAAALGTAFGAVVGAVHRPERWVAVPARARP